MNGDHRPIRLARTCLLSLAAACGLLLGPVVAQQPGAVPSGAQDPGKTTEVAAFALRNTRAADVQRALMAFFHGNGRPMVCTFIIDDRSNSIIVNAPPEEMAKIKTILSKLDAPLPDGEAVRGPHVFRLEGIEPNQALEETLRLVFKKSENGNFALDPQRRLLIVSADENTIKTVARLLASLAEHQESSPRSLEMQVRVVWLVSGLTREDAAAPPDDLKEILPVPGQARHRSPASRRPDRHQRHARRPVPG